MVSPVVLLIAASRRGVLEPTVDELLSEIDRDPTRIFWG